MRNKTRASMALVLLASALAVQPARAAAVGGPVLLMGIDAEDGGPGGHGPIAVYVSAFADVLANASKGSGILVVGGGKTPGDSVTSFWDAIASGTGAPVTYANGTAVGTVSFAPYEVVAVASSEAQTPGGGLNFAEQSALAVRDLDIADHVNAGGGLIGLSQDGFPEPYPYLNSLGSFTVATGRGDSDITPTPEGAAIGISDSLDICCWHDAYLTFPSFLTVLATYTSDGLAAVLGGKRVIIITKCAPETLTATITRPLPGRLYEDDTDIGPSTTTNASVRGSSLTIAATGSAALAQVKFFLDNGLVSTDLSAPFTATIPVPTSLGSHDLRVEALHAAEPCAATSTTTFDVVCFGLAPSITRPAAGRFYENDIDIGSSGVAEAAAFGGALTLAATSPAVPRTASLAFAIDAGPVGVDTSAPYTAAIDTSSLAAGAHTIQATLTELIPECTTSVTVPLLKPDPSVIGRAAGLTVRTNVPAEAVVTAGGATIGPRSGVDDARTLDPAMPSPIDHIRAIDDHAEGDPAGTSTSSASSRVTGVSLAGGMITADVLSAKVRATFDPATRTLTTEDTGSRIANLRIASQPVEVSRPNTTIDVPGVGTLVVQETLVVRDGARGEITVNALHLFGDPGYPSGEIVLGSAHAGVNFFSGTFTGPFNDLIHRPDDADSRGDAGDTVTTALPIAPGLYSGSFGAGDAVDVYSFQTLQGERILAIAKPADRAALHLNRLPNQPSFSSTSPSVRLILRDPSGAVRARGELGLSPGAPEKVELNADTPYSPAGTRGRWTVEVERADDQLGFYSLSLSLLPVPLREQAEAGTDDAPGTCPAARTLTLGPQPGEADNAAVLGVIRDADQADFYRFDLVAGRLLNIAMKPDEGIDGANLDLYLYGPSAPGGPVDCSEPIARSTLGFDPAKALPDAIPVTTERSGTYVVEVRRVNGVANYSLDVNATDTVPTLSDNDAATGSDAGDTCTSATAISVGAHGGTLADVPAPDTDDWYAVTLSAGQDLTAVLKPADIVDLDLELYDPSCAPVAADDLTSNHQPLSVPETVHISNGAAGVYRIRITRATPTVNGNYLLGVAVTA